MAMDQYLLIPFLGGWTSINPSYFDVNYRGTIGFDTLPYETTMRVMTWSDSDGQVIPTEAVEAAGVVGWAEDLAQQIVESLDGGGGKHVKNVTSKKFSKLIS